MGDSIGAEGAGRCQRGGPENGVRLWVLGEPEFLTERSVRGPRRCRYLAADFVQVAEMRRHAEPAVRRGRARLQHRGGREFPSGGLSRCFQFVRRATQCPQELFPCLLPRPLARPVSRSSSVGPARAHPAAPTPSPWLTLRCRCPSPSTARRTAAPCAPARPRPTTEHGHGR